MKSTGWKMTHQVDDKYVVYAEDGSQIGTAERAGERWVISVYGYIDICEDFEMVLKKIDDRVLIQECL